MGNANQGSVAEEAKDKPGTDVRAVRQSAMCLDTLLRRCARRLHVHLIDGEKYSNTISNVRAPSPAGKTCAEAPAQRSARNTARRGKAFIAEPMRAHSPRARSLPPTIETRTHPQRRSFRIHLVHKNLHR